MIIQPENRTSSQNLRNGIQRNIIDSLDREYLAMPEFRVEQNKKADLTSRFFCFYARQNLSVSPQRFDPEVYPLLPIPGAILRLMP
ncbi:TPA: hypothetical protein MO340_004287 [Salmonella enterica subsp. salamae serovar 35:g,m,s,t:-]|nr:hypothetical protein [Salmonella enterica subsp. salamae serovar 35:g,m,s,t:-]HCA3549757.1 hypothetical protein [Salmonella enterica subsp. salamae serovar 35:g,m,s,t:-]